jgi:membrane protease YdiL (CAAX protease family)
MKPKHRTLTRLAAGTIGFFCAFTVLYAALTLLLTIPAFRDGPGDLAAVALAAAACLLLWRIPIRPHGGIFNHPGTRPGAAICCTAMAAAIIIQWPAAGTALAAIVLTALVSVVAEEAVCRGVPVVLLRRSGRTDPVSAATVGAISAGAFVFLHQNTDPWLVADKAIFGAVAFWLALATANLLLPILLHLASNLLLGAAQQSGMVQGNASLLALDCLLIGAVVAAVVIRSHKPDHLPRMATAR